MSIFAFLTRPDRLIVIYRSVGIALSARLRQMSLKAAFAFKPRECRPRGANGVFRLGGYSRPVCVQQLGQALGEGSPTTWKGQVTRHVRYGTVPAVYVSNPQLLS